MVMDSLVYLVYSRFLEHLVGAQSSDSCVILYKIDLIWNFVWYFFFLEGSSAVSSEHCID